jgi:hypothetical protein
VYFQIQEDPQNSFTPQKDDLAYDAKPWNTIFDKSAFPASQQFIAEIRSGQSAVNFTWATRSPNSQPESRSAAPGW